MATKYISGRVKELKIGITSYSENRNSLTVIGNAGIGTVSPTDPVNSSNTSLLSAGIVTAYKFFGDGSNLSGVGNTANITADSLTVTGISTLGTVKIESGIITSTSGIVTYIGDGSRLTGVGNTANITADSLTVAGITTLGITSATDLEAQQLNVSGVSTFIGVVIDANGSLDVDGHTELDEVNIAGVATFGNNIDANGNLDVDGHTELDDLSVTGVSTFTGITTTTSTSFAKNFSSSGISTFADLHVKNPSDTRVTSIAPGALILSRDTPLIYFKNNLADNFDTSIEQHDNQLRILSGGNGATAVRFSTSGIGVTVFGTTETQQLNVSGVSTLTDGIDIADSSLSTPRRLNLGNEQDLKLYHLAGHSYVYNSTGDLLITNQSTSGNIRVWAEGDINLEPKDGDDGVKIIGGGAVELYHNDILRFSTSGIGVSVAGIGSTAYIEGPENIVIDPHPVGGGATSGSVHIKGDLYVDGTEFIVDVDKIELGDFQIGIATTAGTNILLDGAGIGIGSESIRKYITWSNASSSLKSSENWNLASGKHYEIDGIDVLTSNTLGGGIVNSSLTSVGTLGGLVVSGVSTFAGNINANGDIIGDDSTNIVGMYNIAANYINAMTGINAVGVATFADDINANGNIVGDSVTNISGINSVTATEFYGNGSGLTGIDVSRWASNATGIHTLTNVGVGTTTVTGAASPSNTTVLNAGIVTANYFYGDGSGLTGIDVSRWASNATGIHTLTNVGIGTTTVTGAASTTNTTVLNAGIVTANYFYGSGIGLTGTDWAQVNNNLFAGNLAGQCLQSPTSFGNVFIGEEAGRFTTTGDHNISVGYRSGLANCTGSNNVSLGQRSGYGNEGSYNLFFGVRAGYWNYTGNCNIMAGVEAGYCNTFGINNIYLGKNTGRLGSVGSYNLFLGFCAGFSGGGSNNCHNIILGSCAGVAHTSGSYNIFLGERSSYNSTSGSNNIAIGSTVTLPVSGGNNQLAIGQGSNYWINGDSNFNVGIGTTIPTSKFNVQGTSNLNGGVGIADSIFHLDNTDTAIRFPSDNVITFETSGNEKLRVVAGNVGIGTQVPTDQVQSSNTSILAVGILTAYKLYSSVYGEFQGNTVVADTIVGSALSIAGISTLGSVQISSGIVTSTSTSGVVTYYGDGSNLTGIGSDQFTNITVGFLTVTNASEFGGITTVTGDTLYTKQLNVAGVSTFAGNINIPDNISAKFGNDGDLELVHYNTNHSIIRHTGSGDLQIWGDTVQFNASNGVGPSLTVDTVTGSIDVNGSFNVSGVSTFAGITTVTGDTLFTKQLDVSGNVNVSSSGIVTFGHIRINHALNTIDTKFANLMLDSLGGTVEVNDNLEVSGNINANGNIIGDTATNISGINSVTATTYYGSGSGLTGVASTDSWIPDAQENLVAGTDAGAARGADTCCNIAIGYSAGCSLYDGRDNVYLGTNAGYGVTNGVHNIFFGYSAGAGATRGGECNIAIGYEAGKTSTNGEENIFIGKGAGKGSSTSGSNNIFIGCYSGYKVAGSGGNTFIGAGAGQCVTTGAWNIALGYQAIKGATSHSSTNTVAIGYRAGYCVTGGSANLFLGCAAACDFTTGCCNVVIGPTVQPPSLSGNHQLAIGSGTNHWIVGNADFNVGIGTTNPDIAVGAGNTAKLSVGILSAYQLYGDGSNLSNVGFRPDDEGNLVAGTLAGTNKDADTLQNIFLGCKAGCCVNSGDQNIFLGCKAGQYTTGGSHNIGIGAETLGLNQPGDYNIALGYLAGRAPSSTTNNIWIGKCVAAENAVTGIENIAIGCHAMCKASSGAENIAIGREAMGDANVTGSANIVMGSYAGLKFTSANNNVVLGNYAMRNGTDVSATNSVVIGTNAGRNLTSAQSNVLIGNSAGCTLSTTHGNTFLGHQAGCLATGASNVFIGKYTSCSQTAGDRNIVIGCRANLPVLDGSDQILLKAANTFFYGCCNGGCTLVGIGTTGPNDVVGVGVTSKLSVGIVSAYQLYGDGSCLSGVGFSPDAQENLYAGTDAGKCSSSDSCYNVAIGYRAGCKIGTSGSLADDNVFIGKYAGRYNDTGLYNTFLGSNAGCQNSSGTSNVAIGYNALRQLNTGNANTAVGDAAGQSTTGYCNTFLGVSAGSNNTSGCCNIAIGRDVSLPSATTNNQLAIGSGTCHWITGNADFNVGIGTTNPNAAVGAGNTAKLSVGILSAYQLYGDGSELTGISAGLWVSNSTGIHTTSNIGIGTTNASNATVNIEVGTATTALVVQGSQGQLFSVTNSLSSGSIFSVNDISGIPSIDVDADGTIQLAPYGSGEMVGVGTTNPTSKLHVIGDSLITGVVTATDVDSTSDIRLKTNIQPIDNPLAKVIQIEGVSFNWKKDNRAALGVIADQVEKILPQLVHGDDPKTVNYNGLIGLLIEAVKEQQSEIDNLKKRISKLE